MWVLVRDEFRPGFFGLYRWTVLTCRCKERTYVPLPPVQVNLIWSRQPPAWYIYTEQRAAREKFDCSSRSPHLHRTDSVVGCILSHVAWVSRRWCPTSNVRPASVAADALRTTPINSPRVSSSKLLNEKGRDPAPLTFLLLAFHLSPARHTRIGHPFARRNSCRASDHRGNLVVVHLFLFFLPFLFSVLVSLALACSGCFKLFVSF